ncbi:outer membrane protein with glycine zipper [Chitinophaga dinghuensis]|uniref:Outer membrane protein with glycine zipper n=2 Tax=Chitinophaga dinghuensis TaxID=1539050 RepID=A0A327VQQ0_9BACT|nr:outer membrane protein with glycine zipper [Chitinophaga dinghuensis]
MADPLARGKNKKILTVMRKVIVAVSAAVVLFSCKGQPDQAAIESAKKATIDSINNVNLVKQQVIDSMNQAGHHHKKGASEAGYSPATYNAPEEGSSAATAATPAATTAKKKKGFGSWSHTAKGAVVGAGAGAVTGAIVNKDHVKGAAIGTLIGAGVGAGTGAIVDHAKKKKAAQQ